MAIAYDAVSNLSGQSGSASNSYSHTCSGSDRILIVFTTLAPGAGSVSPTSITYNGVALTELGYVDGSSSRIGLWYLLNPATGANNITVTYASATAWYSWASSYTGVGGINNPNSTASGSATSVSTIFTTGNNYIVVDGVQHTENTAPTVQAGQTQIYSTGGSNSQGMSYKSAGSPSTTLGWDGTNQAWLHYGAQLTLIPTPLSVSLAQGVYTLAGQAITLVERIHVRTIAIAQGIYTLTGQAVTNTRGYFVNLVQGSYLVTGLVTPLLKKWINKAKNITNWVNRDKS